MVWYHQIEWRVYNVSWYMSTTHVWVIFSKILRRPALLWHYLDCIQRLPDKDGGGSTEPSGNKVDDQVGGDRPRTFGRHDGREISLQTSTLGGHDELSGGSCNIDFFVYSCIPLWVELGQSGFFTCGHLCHQHTIWYVPISLISQGNIPVRG